VQKYGLDDGERLQPAFGNIDVFHSICSQEHQYALGLQKILSHGQQRTANWDVNQIVPLLELLTKM